MKTPSPVPILAALALACLAAPGCRESNEFVPPPPPQVTVQAPVVREVTTYKEYTGRAEARDTVEVRARVKGFLKTVDFEPGQMVRGPDPENAERLGDLLFTIEPEPFEAAVRAAEAAVAQAEAAKQLAEVTLEKAKGAYDKGAVSEIEMAEKEAQVDATVAAVDAAEAALATARIDLSYTTIHAPIGGRISRELVDVGNLVGAGESTLLTTIVQDDPIYAYVDVAERDLLGYLEKGRPRERDPEARIRALLQLADGSTYEHEGVVDFAEPRVNPATGTLQVRATFPNEEGKLFPGLFIRVLVPDFTGEQMLVPEVALLRDLAGSYVLVADAENVVQRHDIQLGTRVDTDRIVTGGLEPTDRVIVNGIQRAIPGNPVDPQEQTGD
ncbi:MAG: efflux RND transporter periplasmic adaptor subunit [Planctomycetota bacterium]|jgi:RND family efflux transporter MFP subunit